MPKYNLSDDDQKHLHEEDAEEYQKTMKVGEWIIQPKDDNSFIVTVKTENGMDHHPVSLDGNSYEVPGNMQMFRSVKDIVKSLNWLPNIPALLYLDFDGTLSGCPGMETTASNLYRSLQTNPDDFYGDATFLSRDEMVQKLSEGFSKFPTGFSDSENNINNHSMRLAKGALDFLKKMLDIGANINIVTKNRAEYIEALLKYEGFSDEEIAKFKIIDCKHMENKNQAVIDIQTKFNEDGLKSNCTIACDDNKGDLSAMQNALLYTETVNVIKIPSADPGKFNFNEISDKISAKNIEMNEQVTHLSSPPSSPENAVNLNASSPPANTFDPERLRAKLTELDEESKNRIESTNALNEQVGRLNKNAEKFNEAHKLAIESGKVRRKNPIELKPTEAANRATDWARASQVEAQSRGKTMVEVTKMAEEFNNNKNGPEQSKNSEEENRPPSFRK